MSKKYYKLSEGTTGSIKELYSGPQPDKDLEHLEECPFDNDKGVWDGSEWTENESKKAKNELSQTDSDMFRVIDDLLNYIVDGTPIPQEAKDKISNRKTLRDKI